MAESGKIDPMHQFAIEPLFGTDHLSLGGYNIAFTNSALYMVAAAVVLWIFVIGGMKRELVPGRWQMAVEGVTGFIDDMVKVNIGPEGKKFIRTLKKGDKVDVEYTEALAISVVPTK